MRHQINRGESEEAGYHFLGLENDKCSTNEYNLHFGLLDGFLVQILLCDTVVSFKATSIGKWQDWSSDVR